MTLVNGDVHDEMYQCNGLSKLINIYIIGIYTDGRKQKRIIVSRNIQHYTRAIKAIFFKLITCTLIKKELVEIEEDYI